MTLRLKVADSFGTWLWERKRRLALPSLGAAVSLLSGALSHSEEVLRWPWLTTALLAFQAALIFVLLFCMPSPLFDRQESPRASIAVRQFSSAWRKLWLFWFIEFVVLTIHQFLLVVSENNAGLFRLLTSGPWGSVIVPAILNLANNLPTIAIVILYVIASERTVRIDHGQPEPDHLPWDRAVAVVLLITIADLAARANQQAELIALTWDLGKGFDWLSGLAAGMATALLVGRLDSKFINLPVWVVIALYGYAVIQPGWPAFDDAAVRAVLLNLALTLKCLLFVLIWWLFKSGVFLYYIERVGYLYDEVADERYVFLAKVQHGIHVVPQNRPPGTSNSSV